MSLTGWWSEMKVKMLTGSTTEGTVVTDGRFWLMVPHDHSKPPRIIQPLSDSQLSQLEKLAVSRVKV